MARFTAFEQFDIRDFGFSFVSDNFIGGVLIEDIDITIDGITYDDAYAALAEGTSSDFELEFYGSDFTEDASGNLTGGVLNALQGVDTTNSPSTILYFVDELNLDAGDVFDTVVSASTADDDALIAEIFAGDDTFDLSDADDFVQGFAGDDVIDGGAGNDTAIYSGTFAQSTITENSDGSFTIDGPDGTDTLIDVEFVQFSDQTFTLGTVIEPPPTSDPAQLILPEGSGVGVIEGSFNVTGTTGGEEAVGLFTPASGSLTAVFDPSFNSGGDTIRLEGAAGDYTAERSGSSVVLTNGDISATIPVGTEAAVLSFDDSDARELVFDNSIGEVVIGDQVIDTDPVSLTLTAGGGVGVPGTGSSSVGAQLILPENAAVGVIEGNFSITGTTGGDENVGLFTPASGSLTATLDPSFNSGGDTIRLDGEASDYTAERTGSSIVLTNGDVTATIPVGTSLTSLVFNSVDSRPLLFDTSIDEVRIGDQIITSDPEPLDDAAGTTLAPTSLATAGAAADVGTFDADSPSSSPMPGGDPLASLPMDQMMIAESFTAGA